ncbi:MULTISPECIES: lysophospholipase [unclassified Corynebacterium]|uniref:Asp23/Gls24 family envelope stress response protein n=1 Tax=Corynebacterium TaxID=1716 RepID=UPI002550609A|nr:MULTISPECIES: lysophospholipase [unclassified Corynebacterium]MDK8475771.1 lysophospholipase [Corynebacterium sp. MSK310]MDK8673277.1 lysophospholipase [Corynebacterium sp. MSK189]MDK8736539.1 lysophospholipase [Corynebacterium sp. MSK306]
MSEGSTQGHTRFSLRTMERIVTAAIASVPGTKDLDAKLAGIGGRGYPRVSVQMDPEREVAAVSATIAVVWPSPVTAVAESTRAAISEAIAAHTGYSTTRVNVTVGESIPGTRVTAEQLAQRPAASAFTPEVTPSTVTQPVTQDSVEVRSIETPEEAAVRNVDTPQEAEIREISSGKEVAVRGVSVPSGDTPVRSVDTPREAPVRSISADLPDHQLLEISAPEDHELRRIVEPRPEHVRSVRAPRPGRLLPSGQVRPFVKKAKVSVPRPQPLRKIEIDNTEQKKRVRVARPAPLRKVQPPRPQPLRKIEIDNSRSEQRVRTARPASLRKVQAPRQESLKRIEVSPASQRPLHVYAPRPEPLRAISITPYHEQGGNNG